MWKKSILLLTIALLFTGFAHAQLGGQLSVEEQRLLLQLMLKQQGIGGLSPSTIQQPSPPSIQVNAEPPRTTEAELQTAFGQWPKPEKGVLFKRFRDGFSMNGVRHIDPEGQIVVYGFDGLSGDYTYLAQLQSGQHLIKTGRAASGVEPITIATAEKKGTTWSVTTITGARLSGSRLLPPTEN